LLEYLKLSRPTLQKKLKNIDRHNLLITEKRGSNKYYQLNLEELVKTIEKIIAKDSAN
jgi:DNA-binding transcriptional ArsR family regulator